MNLHDSLLAEVVDQLADALAPRVAAALAEQLPHPAPEQWRLLTVDEVAVMLGRSRRSIHGFVKERGLPYVRLDGGALSFDLDEVRAWAHARRVPAANPDSLAGRLQVPPKVARKAASDTRRLSAKQKVES